MKYPIFSNIIPRYFDNGEYPISETEFTSVLSMRLLKITDLITIISKLKRKK